ncbi:MAG: hypothetical protein ACYCW6_04905 [Candidatus Xenobia bacterium]
MIAWLGWGFLGWGLGWVYVRFLGRMVVNAARQRTVPVTLALMLGVTIRQLGVITVAWAFWRRWPESLLPLMAGFIAAWTIMRIRWLRARY